MTHVRATADFGFGKYNHYLTGSFQHFFFFSGLFADPITNTVIILFELVDSDS